MGEAAPQSHNPVLRLVAPLEVNNLKPADISLQPSPELVWLPVSDLSINDEYQRQLSDRSLRAIRRIAENWHWGRVKALTVVRTSDGDLEIIDGQHTAIAAATHGGIPRLPCLVTKGSTIQGRAADFVGINRDRVHMTTMQIFWADVTAEEESAIDVIHAAENAGVSLLKYYPKQGDFEPGQTVAVGALRRLAKRGGVAYVGRVLRIGVAAELAPITTLFINACALMLWNGYNAEKELTDPMIVNVLRIHGLADLEARARQLASGPGKFTVKEALALTIARLA